MRSGFGSIVLLCVLPVLSNRNALAAHGSAGAPFLLVAPGARSEGLGNAYSALADDASSVWWNPAALASAGKYEFEATLISTSPLYYSLVSAVSIRAMLPYWRDFCGIGLDYLAVRDEYADHLDDFPNRSYLNRVDVWTIAVGIKASERTQIGYSFKYFRDRIDYPYQATAQKASYGTANDLSILHELTFRSLPRPISVAAVLANMGSSKNFGQSLPFTLRIGAGYYLIATKNLRLTMSLEATKLLVRNRTNRESDPFYRAFFTAWGSKRPLQDVTTHAGVECWLHDRVALRIGYLNDREDNQRPITLGGSLRLKAARLDVSHQLRNDSKLFKYTTKISIAIYV